MICRRDRMKCNRLDCRVEALILIVRGDGGDRLLKNNIRKYSL